MDPITLAGMAVAAFSPLMTKGAEELTKPIFKDVYVTIKERLSKNPEDKIVVEKFERNPTEDTLMFQTILAERLKDDAELRQMLVEMLAQSGKAVSVLQDSSSESPHIGRAEKQSNIQRFHLKNVRTLLTEGFEDGELRRLCYDEPDFRPVYEQLTQGIGKDGVIDGLIEYAERRELIETLLTLAKERNPIKYKKHQPYYEVTLSSTKGTPGKFQRAAESGSLVGKIEAEKVVVADKIDTVNM